MGCLIQQALILAPPGTNRKQNKPSDGTSTVAIVNLHAAHTDREKQPTFIPLIHDLKSRSLLNRPLSLKIALLGLHASCPSKISIFIYS